MSSPQAFDGDVRWVLEREGCRWNATGQLVATGYVDDPHDPGGETNFGIAKRWHPDQDMKTMTLAQAVHIYLTEYWLRFGCDQMSDPWALFVFDSAVQHPPSAVDLFEKENQLCAALADRAHFYTTLPGFPRYGRGWLRRLSLLQAKLLSEYGVDCPPMEVP